MIVIKRTPYRALEKEEIICVNHKFQSTQTPCGREIEETIRIGEIPFGPWRWETQHKKGIPVKIDPNGYR